MHLWMARYREYGRASRLVGLWRSLLRRGIFSSIHLDPNSLVERQCERAPYLHDTPPLGRWDAGTVGRQEGRASRRCHPYYSPLRLRPAGADYQDMPTLVTITPPSGRTQERTASGSRSRAEGCQSERSLAIVPAPMPNARVTTVTTALSGELPTELRFFGVSYRMPVRELDPAWPRTLMALRQKAPVIDGQRWRLATDVAVERIEVLDVETGEVIVMVRGGFVPA